MEGREVMRCIRCYEWTVESPTHWCSDCWDWTMAGILRDYREVFDRLAKT